MKASQCLSTDEIFTHVDDSGLVRHFNASAVGRAMPCLVRSGEAELVCVEIDPAFIEFIKKHRGVEAWKVDRLKEPYLSRPLIGCCMPDGTVLTIDGHHRLVVLHKHRRKHYYIHLVNITAWGAFLVDDMPAFLEGVFVTGVMEQVRSA